MGGSGAQTNGIYVTIGLLLILTVAGGFFLLERRSEAWRATAERFADALQERAPGTPTPAEAAPASASAPTVVQGITEEQMEAWAAVIVKAIDEGFARAAANADERDAALLAAVADTIDGRLALLEQSRGQGGISREELEATIFDQLATMIEQQIDRRMDEMQDRQARISLTRTQIRTGLSGALEAYRTSVGHYPGPQDGGLYALLVEPTDDLLRATWEGPYLQSEMHVFDAWGNPLAYENPGQHNVDGYDLASAGPDGRFGTVDDITNWAGGL